MTIAPWGLLMMGEYWPSACVTSPDHGECEKGSSNGWGHVALCPVFAATSQVRYFSRIWKLPPVDCYQRFLKTTVSTTFVTLRQIFGAGDFGPQPHLDRDGFHERTSTPSFQASQAAKANWNTPKVDQQLKRMQQVRLYSLGDIVFGYFMSFRGPLWILRLKSYLCLNRWTRPCTCMLWHPFEPDPFFCFEVKSFRHAV